MIVELQEHSGPLPTYDVCVIGSGPAGMTVAAELARAGARLCVLESGLDKVTPHGDLLRDVRSEGIHIKDYSRERVLGGASTTWAGLSSPLDPIDMERRPYLRHSGWPIERGELLPYYEAAAARYRFPRLAMFGEDGLAAVREQDEITLRWRELDEKIFLARADPQDFGREQKAIFERDGVDLYLDATVLRLACDDGQGRASRACVRTRGGRDVDLAARVFVVATGGIENARLLLRSTDACERGLGNDRDQVGRFLMNHPKNYFGVIRLNKPVVELSYYFGSLHRGFAGYAGLRLPEELQRRRGLLNAYVRFEPIFPWSDNVGVESFVLLAKRSSGLLRRWRDSREEQVTSLRDYSETGDDSDLQNQRRSLLGHVALGGAILRHLPTVTRYGYHRLVESARPRVREIRLRNFLEMEPDPDNRVVLSDDRDVYGERLALVRHDTTELDRRSLVEVHRILADEVRASGIGVLEGDLAAADPWPIDQDASHHLGSTRMGVDPATSVVDPDCRIHGVDNVYLAGGSVFPTSGCANPTFTIVALAIRLAERLSRELPGVDIEPSRARSTSPRETSMPDSEPGARRVVVIGAGGRVLDTALPAFLACRDRFTIARVYARSERELRVGDQEIDTVSFDRLEDDGLGDCDLVYAAISKPAVPDVLKRLAALPVEGVDLLIDTPPLSFKQLKHVDLFARFRAAWVAEDCVELPYLPLVREAFDQGGLGSLREVLFLQSAYRYHGFATLKALFGGAVRRARRSRIGRHSWCDLWMEGGGRGRLLEPRDYRSGRTLYLGSEGSISDYPLRADGNRLLEPVVDQGDWIGFRVGDARMEFSDAERRLLLADGPPSAIGRMEDMKRVGFLRLLRRIAAGDGAYPLAEGLDDMAIDFFLEKTGRYRAVAPLSVKSAVGRRLLKTVTGVARG